MAHKGGDSAFHACLYSRSTSTCTCTIETSLVRGGSLQSCRGREAERFDSAYCAAFLIVPSFLRSIGYIIHRYRLLVQGAVQRTRVFQPRVALQVQHLHRRLEIRLDRNAIVRNAQSWGPPPSPESQRLIYQLADQSAADQRTRLQLTNEDGQLERRLDVLQLIVAERQEPQRPQVGDLRRHLADGIVVQVKPLQRPVQTQRANRQWLQRSINNRTTHAPGANSDPIPAVLADPHWHGGELVVRQRQGRQLERRPHGRLQRGRGELVVF